MMYVYVLLKERCEWFNLPIFHINIYIYVIIISKMKYNYNNIHKI